MNIPGIYKKLNKLTLEQLFNTIFSLSKELDEARFVQKYLPFWHDYGKKSNLVLFCLFFSLTRKQECSKRVVIM
jgi:hypothetical protein